MSPSFTSNPNSPFCTVINSSGSVYGTPVVNNSYTDQPLQHDKVQPIPLELQRGWWNITDVEVMKSLIKCLHPRGIRERNLQRTFQRFYDHATDACSNGKKDGKILKPNSLLLLPYSKSASFGG